MLEGPRQERLHKRYRMEGLHAYLQRASEDIRKLKTSPNGASLHVVLGNEALDLDSAVASVLFAYFLDATKANDSEVVIPVMSIPRQDWNLRTETKYLFSKKEIQISADELIFMDDLPMELLDKVFEGEKLRLSLVDHNVPTAILRKYNASIVNIIDHHEDFTSQLRLQDGSFPSLNIKEIVVVGSATTLIAERMLADTPTLITGPVASMLIAPILIDTVNLDEKMNRVTPRDRAALDGLCKVAGVISIIDSLDDFYSKLQFAKTDVSAIPTPDLLRKDYKEWTCNNVKYGIASVMLPLADWINRDGERFVENLKSYYDVQQLNVLVVMTAYQTENQTTKAMDFHRELVFFSPNLNLKSLLELQSTDSLKLENFSIAIPSLAQDSRLACFSQREITSSRKQVQPLIETILKSKM